MTDQTPKMPNHQAPTAGIPQRPIEVAAREEPPASIPRSIGGYHIKQVIESGGIGTVYLVIQDQPRRPGPRDLDQLNDIPTFKEGKGGKP